MSLLGIPAVLTGATLSWAWSGASAGGDGGCGGGTKSSRCRLARCLHLLGSFSSYQSGLETVVGAGAGSLGLVDDDVVEPSEPGLA